MSKPLPTQRTAADVECELRMAVALREAPAPVDQDYIDGLLEEYAALRIAELARV